MNARCQIGILPLNDAENQRHTTIFRHISESDRTVSLFISNFNANFRQSCAGAYYK